MCRAGGCAIWQEGEQDVDGAARAEQRSQGRQKDRQGRSVGVCVADSDIGRVCWACAPSLLLP